MKTIKKANATDIAEMCPYCDTEVKLKASYKTPAICPNCGKYILPCSICNCDIEDCSECAAEKECARLNQNITTTNDELDELDEQDDTSSCCLLVSLDDALDKEVYLQAVSDIYKWTHHLDYLIMTEDYTVWDCRVTELPNNIFKVEFNYQDNDGSFLTLDDLDREDYPDIEFLSLDNN